MKSGKQLFATTNKPKRQRRTAEQLDDLLALVQKIIKAWKGVRNTIRHLNYLLSGKYKVIPKTEQAFEANEKQFVKWRKSRLIPYGAFADFSRSYIERREFDSADEAHQWLTRTYRQRMWKTQPYYCEVWRPGDEKPLPKRDPQLAAFYEREAKDVELPLFGRHKNMTIEAKLLKDPSTAALVRIAEQIARQWNAEDVETAKQQRAAAELALKKLEGAAA